jgi:hypothetical protein
MNTTWVKRAARGLPLAAVCLALTGLAGCKPARATVTGKVTLNNKTLTGGTVSFVASKSLIGSGAINQDGTYTVNDAPVGEVTITVQTPMPTMGPMVSMKPPAGMGGMPAEMRPPGDQSAQPLPIVPAPDKYKSAETSPLHFTVAKGNQSHDIELTP